MNWDGFVWRWFVKRTLWGENLVELFREQNIVYVTKLEKVVFIPLVLEIWEARVQGEKVGIWEHSSEMQKIGKNNGINADKQVQLRFWKSHRERELYFFLNFFFFLWLHTYFWYSYQFKCHPHIDVVMHLFIYSVHGGNFFIFWSIEPQHIFLSEIYLSSFCKG